MKLFVVRARRESDLDTAFARPSNNEPTRLSLALTRCSTVRTVPRGARDQRGSRLRRWRWPDLLRDRLPRHVSPSRHLRRFGFSRARSLPTCIQIFDPNGRLLALWKQFGRPSSVYIDKNDTLYVGDSQSTARTNPGFKQGIRIGSAKDGKVTAFIPLIDPALGAPEEVAADDDGNVYAGFTDKEPAVKKFVKN